MNQLYKYILLLIGCIAFQNLTAQRSDTSMLSVSMSWKYRDQMLHIHTNYEKKQIKVDEDMQITIKLYGSDTIKIGASNAGGSPTEWVSLAVVPNSSYNYELQKTITSSLLKPVKKPIKQTNKKKLDLIVGPDGTKVAEVGFTIVDSKGKPLADVQVKDNTTNKVLKSNEKGMVLFTQIDAGNTIFSISKPSFKAQNHTENIVALKNVNIPITLHNEYGRLVVTIYDENNKPMQGVQISESAFKNGGKTDVKGEWILENIKEGSTNITTTIKDYKSQTNKIDIVAETSVSMKISMIPLPDRISEVSNKTDNTPTGVLKGTVVYKTNGLPVWKATISIAGQGTVETDKEGKFAITVKTGDLSAVASKPPVGEKSRRFISTTQMANIQVNQPYSIRFELEPEPIMPMVVSVPSGTGNIETASLALTLNNIKSSLDKVDYQVKINGKRMLNLERMLNELKIPSGVKDNYSVELALLPEQYELLKAGNAKIEIEDMAYPDVPAFDIEMPKFLINREVKQGDAGMIKGVIKDVNGKPVSGALVTVSNSPKNAVTDNNGVFKIENVPAGSVIISAKKPNCDIPSITQEVGKGEVLNTEFISTKSDMVNAIQNGNFLLHIQFSTASSVIPEQYTSDLNELLNAINTLPEKHFIIEGHTDSDGTAEDNRKLSVKRAESVMKWLIAHGAKKEVLSSTGYGEDRPYSSNETKEGKTLNRRVEILVR